MTPEAHLATNLLVAATVAMNVFVIAFLAIRLFAPDRYRTAQGGWGKYGLLAALCASAIALFGSMAYSMVTGFAACPLCLASRVLIALLVVSLLVGLAFPRLRSPLSLSATVLALVGLLVSGYQYLLQWLALSGVHLYCPAIEGLPTCDRIYFMEFGYVTIPFAAFSAFAFVLALLAFSKREVSVSGK